MKIAQLKPHVVVPDRDELRTPLAEKPLPKPVGRSSSEEGTEDVLSDETRKGISRFADFLKKKKIDIRKQVKGLSKRERGLSAYKKTYGQLDEEDQTGSAYFSSA